MKNYKKAFLTAAFFMVLVSSVTYASNAQPSSEFNEADVNRIAKTLYGECRSQNIPTAQKAAVVWCILNRLDDGSFGDNIQAVVSTSQFHGYSPDNPVSPELESLTKDVLDRWTKEQNGEADVGRTLPSSYLYFAGDGERNRFRTGYETRDYWDWSWPDPYQEGTDIDEQSAGDCA